MKMSFHGADQDVTGSCHLVHCGDKRILVDCGLYQGSRELQEENHEPFGFDPASIDFLLLTHAHLDHCGRIPLLVKKFPLMQIFIPLVVFLRMPIRMSCWPGTDRLVILNVLFWFTVKRRRCRLFLSILLIPELLCLSCMK